MSAYRDDHRPMQEVGQHLGIAEELLGQFERIPGRLVEDISHEGLEQLKGEARSAWEGVWDHLRQASDLIRTMGRSTRGFDGARALAGDIYVGAIDVHVGPWERGFGGQRRRTITWRNAPTRPAVDAIAALRAAVPEVVVVKPAATHVDLRSHGWLVDWWPWLVIVAIAGLVAWRCAA